MKDLIVLLLSSVLGFEQATAKGNIIDFDPADRDHCKLVTMEGRPLRQISADGTSVAVGTPAPTSDGEFRVFVAIRQTGEGKARVKPGDFFALYSDSAHTRFTFRDIGAEIDARRMREAREESSTLALSAPGDSRTSSLDAAGGRDRLPTTRRRSRGNLNGPARDKADENAKLPGSVSMSQELYLRGGTLQPGGYISGLVYFKRPRRSKIEPGSTSSLSEIDIPVNGLVFRFR